MIQNKIPSSALFSNQIYCPPVLQGSLPNTAFSIALIAFLLGSVFGLNLLPSIQLLTNNIDNLSIGKYRIFDKQLSLYLIILCWFHLWEFLSTAGWNSSKTSVDC